MLFHPTEMHIELMQMLQQGAKRRSLGHLGEGIDILGEALATIAILTIRSWNVGVGVVDVAGEKDASVDFTPVGSHLLAVFAASVEVSYLIGTEDVVHILGQLSL